MNKKDKWIYQNFAGLIGIPDEYQRHEIDKLMAKIAIIALYTLLALVYLSIFLDIERAFLSPFTIGGVLLIIILFCRVSMNQFSAAPVEIEVHDQYTYHQLLKETRNKRIIFLVIALIYMPVTATIVAPILAGNPLNFSYLFNISTYLPFLMWAIFTVAKDSRVKLIKKEEDADID